MLAGIAIPAQMLAEVVFAVSTAILAAVLITVYLKIHRLWTASGRYTVAIAAGIVVAVVVTLALALSWRGKQIADGQPTPEAVGSGTSVASSAAPSAEASASESSATGIATGAPASQPSVAPSVPIDTSQPSAQPMATEAPPTVVQTYDTERHGAWVAALRAYVAHEPDLLSDRNVVLSYVDQVFFASAKSQCHNGQVSEFDEHRYYDTWVRQIKNDVTRWHDDVPLTFDTTLGTYDFQRHELPLQLNPQGLLVYTSGNGFRNCTFATPVEQPFSYNEWYQIAPGTVPGALAVSPARGEQILNLVGGRRVNVALHGHIETMDPHFVFQSAAGYGVTYQPTEVTVRSGLVPIYHALIRGSK